MSDELREQLIVGLVRKLEELHGSDSDPEIVHSMADGMLLAFINDLRVLEAFNKVPKWYA